MAKVTMINLGIYKTVDGKTYACRYFKEEKTAVAIGPLSDRSGRRRELWRGPARSEAQARQKIAEIIGPGSF